MPRPFPLPFRQQRVTAGAAIAALLLLPIPAAAADPLAAVVTDPASKQAPGCIAARFERGQMTAMAASGYADIKRRTPIDPDTLFYGASLSKQFTALAAATLIAQGKLSLDDDARDHLPDLPRYAVPVTVGMLMHHSAGIRDSLGLLRLAGMDNVGLASKRQALNLVYAQADTAFTPGTQYRYSNGGYLLLAEIVERVAGEPFALYADRAIFKPLGMAQSHFLNDAQPRPGRVAHGYVPVDGGFAIRDSFPRFSGSGGLMISLSDLARFERDIAIERKVWTPAVARIMLTPGRFSGGSPIRDAKLDMGYGGGLHIGPLKGEYRVQHGGSAEGFKHSYVRMPERHRAFALLCNRGDWSASERMERIIAASDTASDPAARTPPAGLFRSAELGADYALAPDGERLMVRISSRTAGPRARTLQFVRQPDGSYAADTIRIRFGTDPDRFTVSRGGSGDIGFERVKKGRTE
ncbi:MAG: serine hydrolase domain-containing protein [Sphingopyxis sp.]|uniref:serine hydrolase domain-containing protein n=1 Tax=Sphingopyxis sp. TaxID=1908224 RepID=UPI002AB8A5A7|nr:serine hydrolase domain-containing protein [Sphingopyxis sp.]MDZ3831644.1 serine hydrolase domain-containing protein [Sphingopyxis sp.]